MKKQLLLIMMALLLCINLTACTDSTNESQNSSSNTATDPSSEESKEETPTEINIGETITLGDWQVTVNSFELMDSIRNDTRIFEADEGFKFVTIELTVINTGDEEARFAKNFVTLSSDILCYVYYQGEEEYLSTQLLSYDEDLHNGDIAPSESRTGILVFSVEEEKAQSSELTFDISLDKQSYTYKLV